MSNVQKKILVCMAVLSFLVNIAAVASAFWRDSDLEAQGISIEQILKEGRK